MFKTNKLESLTTRSASAMNTFSAVLANLTSINDDVDKEVDELSLEQGRIQKEKESLIEMRAKNENVAKKIEEFFELK